MIYHENHVKKNPFKRNDSANNFECGVDNTFDWMNSIQHNGLNEDNFPSTSETSINDYLPNNTKESLENIGVNDYNIFYKYTKEANSFKRSRRSARKNPNKKKSCSLYIQTDPLFWRHIREQVM